MTYETMTESGKSNFSNNIMHTLFMNRLHTELSEVLRQGLTYALIVREDDLNKISDWLERNALTLTNALTVIRKLVRGKNIVGFSSEADALMFRLNFESQMLPELTPEYLVQIDPFADRNCEQDA